MKSLTAIIICLLLFLVFVPSRAQENRPTPCPKPRDTAERFDSFQHTSVEFEQAVLDPFAVRLQTSPEEIGYIVVYAGRVSCAGEAQMRGMRMKKYLVEHRSIDSNRIIWRDGGYLDKPLVLLEEQWRGNPCPLQYDYPRTIDRKGVRIIKCNATDPKRRKRGKLNRA